jgi:hypothetical protein
MFRAVPLSIISFSLYTQQWYLSGLLTSCEQAVSKPVWHIPLLCVQWKTPDDGQWNCPKRIKFQSKNKFEKLVHLFGFIIRNFSLCTVTWTSNYVVGSCIPWLCWNRNWLLCYLYYICILVSVILPSASKLQDRL